MKLRIRDNKIRLRLSQSEVALLKDECLLSATLRFPGDGQFRYALECSPACVRAHATFAEGELRVVLPESVVTDWAGSDQVGIRAEQAIDGGDVLQLLIEKDFRCLSSREGEDDADAYPHPEQGRGSC